MSNTRRAPEGSTFRQERFASSEAYERGLMANLVAKRCSVLERAEDRELIWFVQLVSHQAGGIKKLAGDLMAQFPDRIASDSMRKFGMRAAQIYSTSQVKKVREELGQAFPLKGEFQEDEWDLLTKSEEELQQKHARLEFEARFQPSSYPAVDFVKCCRDAAVAGLEKHLLWLCLDPAQPVADGSPWYFPTLISTLREVQSKWITEHSAGAVTGIGRTVSGALDYAMSIRKMIIIDGMPRIGKTHAAKAWCNQNPGRARYVDCPCGNDDFSFYRDIALSLGVSINLKSKAQELRNRIEESLRGGDLGLVIDQAHWLWPQSHYRHTTPARIDWIMRMADRGVAIMLITTKQFFRSQKAIEDATSWTADQFLGRIEYCEKLTDSLSDDDLRAVALALLPGGNSDSIKALVKYAQSSRKYLAGIDSVVNRARFICRRDDRQKVEFRDVKHAILESVIPSDTALTEAIGSAVNPARKRAAKVFAAPLQGASSALETRLPVERESRHSLAPAGASCRNARPVLSRQSDGENFAETVSAESTCKT